MLKIKGNNVKLQIWDTVTNWLFRQDNKVLKPLQEDTIEMQLVQS
jgi:hypothetical protein